MPTSYPTIVFSKQVTLIRVSLLISLLSLLAACSNNRAAQNLFAADPKLTENSDTTLPPSGNLPNSNPVQLPTNFPQDFPRDPQATLLGTEATPTGEREKTRWESAAPSNRLASFYERELPANNWEIVQPFTADVDNTNTLIASRDGVEVQVSIVRTSPKTEFLIEYPRTENSSQSGTEVSNPVVTGSPVRDFADLEQVAPPLGQQIQDLAALGVLTPAQAKGETATSLFKPNDTITRREYARWLVAANNKMYENQSGKQIRLASTTSQPTFADIKPDDPDFAAIQGLAEAGVIPSPLTGDSQSLLFRPDAPLTRENLIEWKVPLDLRKAAPNASLEAIKETWGFQDAAQINSPQALRSLYADFQNGEQANVRRVFGYTTLFQPKKPVTRAEAAAALWYFGYQGEGISADQALQANSKSPS